MSVVITVAGPHEEAVSALYEFGTVRDLTDVAVQPEPAGHIRITATSPAPVVAETADRRAGAPGSGAGAR